MKRFPILTIPVALALAVLAAAQDPAGPADEAARLGQLRRNRALIQDLVASGLSLAAEEDPLKRADSCHGLAQCVVGEIRQAAAQQEHDRAVELSDHLHALLKLGVAGNLRTVRLESSPSSTREVEVQRVGAQVRELVAPLEELLGELEPDAGELRRVLRNVREARAEVEKALKVRGRP
jgi:hypothetical protein